MSFARGDNVLNVGLTLCNEAGFAVGSIYATQSADDFIFDSSRVPAITLLVVVGTTVFKSDG